MQWIGIRYKKWAEKSEGADLFRGDQPGVFLCKQVAYGFSRRRSAIYAEGAAPFNSPLEIANESDALRTSFYVLLHLVIGEAVGSFIKILREVGKHFATLRCLPFMVPCFPRF